MEKSFLKIMLMVLVILYVISPIDAMPGPIDDVIVLLLGFAAKKESVLRRLEENGRSRTHFN